MNFAKGLNHIGFQEEDFDRLDCIIDDTNDRDKGAIR